MSKNGLGNLWDAWWISNTYFAHQLRPSRYLSQSLLWRWSIREPCWEDIRYQIRILLAHISELSWVREVICQRKGVIIRATASFLHYKVKIYFYLGNGRNGRSEKMKIIWFHLMKEGAACLLPIHLQNFHDGEK